MQAGSHKALKIASTEKDMRSAIPEDLHPHEFILKKLHERGHRVKALPFDEVASFFEEPTEAEIDAYCAEVIDAVRSANLEKLREQKQQGKTLRCSNRFGETLLHLACRKQRLDVVDFLINEGGVSPAVRDDFGRTPLHDACWTPTPNFDLVDLIVHRCPDLLYIKDRRGHTPLFYARQNHWQDWIKHLEERIDSLVPCEQFLEKEA